MSIALSVGEGYVLERQARIRRPQWGGCQAVAEIDGLVRSGMFARGFHNYMYETRTLWQ